MRRIQHWHSSKITSYIFSTIFILTGAILLFYNFNNYFLWGDEGTTAMYGKLIIKHGLPYGSDDRNVLMAGGNGLPMFEPWLVLYLSALSMMLFGLNEFGARLIFVVIGLLALLAQYFFVREYFKSEKLALINLVLMATSASFLLFARQCRYYSLVMLLAPLVGYVYLKYKPVFSTLVLASLLFITFFFSNYLVAIPLLISMAIAFFIFDDKKRAFSFFVKSLPLVFLFVFGWFLLFNDPGIVTGNASILRNIHPSSFGRIIILYFKDYNLSQLLPYGMIILLVLLWLKDGIFNSFEKFMNKRKELAIIVTIVLFTIILSIISPQYSHAANSDIRHATAIFPFLLLVQSFAIMRIYDWRKWAGILLIFVAVWTNLFTFMPYRSFLYEYVRENLHPFDNSVKQSVKFLREKVHQEDTILVSPNHMVGTMEFYLEDKLLFCGVVPPQYKNATVRGRNIPDYAVGCEYNPDWVVLFGLKADQPHTYEQLKKLNLSSYTAYKLPIYGPDVSRPEIFWRSFHPVQEYPEEMSLYVLERKK